jgi:lipopolysaccharide biosynthesis protein
MRPFLKKLKRAPLILWLKTVRYIGPLVATPFGYLRKREHIIESWGDLDRSISRAVIFVHFDSTGTVKQNVIAYLSAFQELGVSVVFVTNSGSLQPDCLEPLKNICSTILIRRNVGYDFGAWQEGLHYLKTSGAECKELFLVNDSVIGPFQPLKNVIERIRWDEADVWGLTESWQISYHLQSYFLCANERALKSEAWRKFWQNVRPIPSKDAIIQRYEVGLTSAMQKGGLLCRAVWPLDSLLLSNHQFPRHHINPTAHCWRHLLECGFPFIKRELVLKNPARIADASEWKEVVRSLVEDDRLTIPFL